MAAQAPVESTPPASITNSLLGKEAVPTQDRPQKFTRLSPKDLAMVCQAIGGVSDDEHHALLHPKSTIYPPKGLPDGLYRDAIRSRTVSQYQYFFVAAFFNLSLILQLLLGACLTALGSIAKNKDIPITVLAAANTVIAGLLALMHNSGLPDRYKKDWNEFDNVESYIKELMESGIARDGLDRDSVIEHCFEMYRKAKNTVAKNKPAAYASGNGRPADPNEQMV
jgi:SMODS and SLOG-associating 2TM effector domain